MIMHMADSVPTERDRYGDPRTRVGLSNQTGGERMGIIAKYRCNDDDCGRSFLVDGDNANGIDLICPFCGEVTEAVAEGNPEYSFEDQLSGCLWPD